MDKDGYFKALYRTEKLHELIYARLAAGERNQKLKLLLRQLSDVDRSHAALWHSIIEARDYGYTALDRLNVFFILVLRRLLGLAISVKIAERGEANLSERLERASKNYTLTSKENHVLHKINIDGKKKEGALHERIVAHSKALNNIRDITFGMNDGLVEVLAAIAGLAAALRNPSLVLIGGIIVAVSGTLSMSGGAYLSTEYERSISNRGEGRASPAASAAYIGVFYALGALVPLLPFAAGLGGYAGIAASVIITSIVLIVISTLISIVSDSSIIGRVLKTLAISLGAAAITILIGFYARVVLHIYL